MTSLNLSPLVGQCGESFQKAPAGTLRRLKRKADRMDEKKLKAWRAAVWKRECDRCLPMMTFAAARCQHCRMWVYRPEDGASAGRWGEVHHRISRRFKATRYDPDNGVLLCGGLGGCHEKATRHLITV